MTRNIPRFSQNIQVSPSRNFSPQLDTVNFNRSYLEHLNAISNLGKDIFNATKVIADKAERTKQAAEQATLADIAVGDIVQTNRIYNENKLQGNNPEMLAKRLEDYRDSKAANMSEELTDFYRQDFDRRAATLVVKSQNEFYKQAQDETAQSLESAQQIIKDDIFKNPLPTTEIGFEHYENSIAKFQSILKARVEQNFITEEEAILDEKEFKKDLFTQAYKADLASLPDEASRAQSILDLHNSKEQIFDLNEKDKEDVIKKLHAYNNTISNIEEKAASAKTLQIKQENAKLAADLEIQAINDEITYEDVLAAEEQGIITPNKRVSLYRILDNNKENFKTNNEDINRVFDAYTGNVFLDPKNNNDKKAVDLAYSKVIVPELEKVEDLAARKQLITNFVSATGIVPETLRGEFRGVFRGDNVDQKVFYADLIGRLRQVKPQAIQDFDDADVLQGVMIHDMVRAGTSNEKAVEKVEAMTTGLTSQETSILKDTMRNYWSDKGNATDQQNYIISEMLDEFDTNWFFSLDASLPKKGKVPFFKEVVTQAGIETAITRDYKNAFEVYYMSSKGDVNLATKLTKEKLLVDWGVTDINGTSKQLTKYPIEKEYAMMDASNRHNYGPDTKYLKQELLSDLKQISEYSNIKAEDVFLIGDEQTGREKYGGLNPSYKVMIFNESGQLEVPIDENYRRWTPDINKFKKEKAPQIKKIIKDKLLKEEAVYIQLDDVMQKINEK